MQLKCSSTNEAASYVSSAKPTATVACPSGCLASSGSVWGTGVYTSGSGICRAAIHAGAITDAGGSFLLTYLPGKPAYTGARDAACQPASCVEQLAGSQRQEFLKSPTSENPSTMCPRRLNRQRRPVLLLRLLDRIICCRQDSRLNDTGALTNAQELYWQGNTDHWITLTAIFCTAKATVHDFFLHHPHLYALS